MVAKNILDYFAEYIHEELGIVYGEENYFQLESRLKDISVQLGHDNVDVFYKKCRDTPLWGHEKQLLLDLATNNETSFFRDPRVFEGMKELITEVIQRKPARNISVWSSACSSGQEPYSLAMVMEELKETIGFFTYDILATDISNRILERAKSGEYSQIEVQRGLPAKRLVKYFEPGSSDMNSSPTWKVKESLRKNLKFDQVNLLSHWTIPKFDLVLMRNVLIYQPLENRKQIVEQVQKHLEPGGYFVLGGPESLIGITDAFKKTKFGNSVFYQIAD